MKVLRVFPLMRGDQSVSFIIERSGDADYRSQSITLTVEELQQLQPMLDSAVAAGLALVREERAKLQREEEKLLGKTS